MAKRDFIFGFLLTVLLTIYFFIMKAAHLYEFFNLRFVNVVFFLLITWMAIRKFYEDNPDRKFNYLTGLMAGFRPAVFGIFLFAGFQVIYLSFDVQLLNAIAQGVPLPDVITPFTASLYLFFEGVAVALITSYISMRIVDARQIEGYEERL